MSTIIKNGTIVTGSDVYKADVKIDNGTISEISQSLNPEPNDRVIDASNQYVFPGGIDVHTHLDLPGTVDNFESGTKAAAHGGITSIINYTNPVEGQSILENIKYWKEKAEDSYIDYGFHSIIDTSDDALINDLEKLANEEGVSSIKLFMANQDKNVVMDDADLYRIMKRSAELGILVNIHAENGVIIDQLVKEAVEQGNTSPIYHAYTRPAILEAEAISRVLMFSEMLNMPIYIVHVSSEEALKQIELAKQRNLPVIAETCPQYLVLDESYLEKPNDEGVKYICSPPLRKKKDQNKLWEGIANNIISTVASDHSSIPFKNGKYENRDNFAEVSNGSPGIENNFSLLYSFGVHEKRISLEKFVDVISTNPAKTFGLYPKKGTIRVGSDADIVILDPNKTKVITQKEQVQSTDYNLYEGIKVHGDITTVLSRGEELVSNGTFNGKQGRGKFLYRSTNK